MGVIGQANVSNATLNGGLTWTWSHVGKSEASDGMRSDGHVRAGQMNLSWKALRDTSRWNQILKFWMTRDERNNLRVNREA